MKKYNGLLMLSATLAILSIILSGCNNAESAVDVAQHQIEIKDSDVTRSVQQALLDDEKLSQFDLTVFTRKGDVLLMGLVDKQNHINNVNKLVRDIEGVHTIHNHLSVKKQ